MSKTALVLAGGGSRGAYQIGVWQALKELSIDIDIAVGTSVGALNAALVTIDDFDTAYELWKNIKTSMVFDVNLDESLPVNKKINIMIRQFLKDYRVQGGTDAYPLKLLLDKYCSEDKIRKSSIECGMVVVDKKTLKPLKLYKEDIKEGQLTEYLLASSSLFPAIKSCEIDGNNYIDGGYYDNLPVELATRKGADLVIAVDLEAVGIVRKNTFKDADKLIVLRSYWDLGPLLVFDADTIMRNIRLGYLDTMKEFKAFEGIAFTFIKNTVPAFVKKNDRFIKEQNEVLGIFKKDEKRTQPQLVMMNMQNYFKRKYAKDIDLRYTVFLRCCAETAGEMFKVDELKIYSMQKFNEVLLKHVSESEIDGLDGINEYRIGTLKKTLSLLDKKQRTIYIGALIKHGVIYQKNYDMLSLSMLFPEELAAGYYLSLIS